MKFSLLFLLLFFIEREEVIVALNKSADKYLRPPDGGTLQPVEAA